jgi:hypothetical protein
MNDPFKKIADETHFNIYHSDLWRGTARRFSEAIVEQCASMCMSQADRKNIRTAFGLPVESNIKYHGPEASGSVESQYQRKYNLPEN